MTKPGKLVRSMLDEMVRVQIEARGIRNPRVLRSMRTVPRQEFVPERHRALAHADFPLPIGYGQTISQPYIVAVMTDVLHTEPGDKILEVGTGCGYQAAILAEMGCEVYTMEIVPELVFLAADHLERLGYGRVRIRCGNGYAGWPEEAPFQGIIVTCAPESIPPILVDQLAPGGSMVIPVGPTSHCQQLELLKKTADGLTLNRLMAVSFVPMVGNKGRGDPD